MIQNIRDWSTSWFSWVIVAVICLTFALWGVHSYFGGSMRGGSVATVNGEVISQNQVTKAYEGMRRSLMSQYNNEFKFTPIVEEGLKKRALQDLVASEALMQAARNSGYVVAPAQITQTVRALPEFQVDGRFSDARFEQFLSLGLYSEQSFVQAVERSELINQIKLSYVISTFALPQDVSLASNLINQTREVATIEVPLQYFNATDIVIPESALRSYYQDNLHEFATPETVRIEYIELSADALAQSINPTQEQLEGFFEANIDKYSTPAKMHLKILHIDSEDLFEINENIKMSNDIDALSGLYPGAKIETKWVTRLQLSPTMLDSLTQKDVMTKPVDTQSGYDVYVLEDSTPKSVASFDEAKDKALIDYKRENAQARYALEVDEMTNITFEQPESLEPAAKALGLTVQSTDYFSKEGEEKGLLSNAFVLSAAFSDDVLRDGNNSQVIHVSTGVDVALRVKDSKAAQTEPFDSIKPVIKEKLVKVKQQKHVIKLAEKIVNDVQAGQSIQEAAGAYDLSVNEIGYIARNNEEVDPEIIGAVFGVQYKADQPEKNITMYPHDSGDYTIVLVTGLQAEKSNEALVTDDQIKEQFAIEFGHLEYALYSKTALDEAKIEYE